MKFKDFPLILATNSSIANRKPIFGVGINDVNYMVTRTNNGKLEICPAYRVWSGMLTRVYSKKYQSKKTTYKGVSVCTEWLSFSKFREWFSDNYTDGFELDKDLTGDNRTYTPENCIFVPTWLNSFTISSMINRGDCLIGTYFDKTSNKYIAQCRNPKSGKRETLGVFIREIDAHNAWLARKLKLADELKNEMDCIDMRIYPRVVEIIKTAV